MRNVSSTDENSIDHTSGSSVSGVISFFLNENDVSMRIHSKKQTINGLDDNEMLFVCLVGLKELHVVFDNWGSKFGKFFMGKDEVETIYEKSGKKSLVLYTKLVLKKLSQDKSTTFSDLETMCDELNLAYTKNIW